MGLLLGQELVEAADQLAADAHAGQWYHEEEGRLYIEHPRDAANLVRDWGYNEVVIGAVLLHDVFEMTWVTPIELRKRCFPLVLVEGVVAMTVTDNEEAGLSRSEKVELKIARARSHPISHVGKLADAGVNIATSISDPGHLERRRKGKARDNFLKYSACLAGLKNDMPTPDEIEAFTAKEIAHEQGFTFYG